MPEPVSTIFLIVTALSAGIGAYSSIQQGEAAANAEEYNAQVAENNAIQARNEAEYELGRTREKYRRVRGTQVANAAKSGVILDNSLSAVFLDTALTEDLDALSTLYKGSIYAGNQQAQASLHRSAAENARSSGMFGAVGSVLGGVGSGISKFPTIK